MALTILKAQIQLAELDNWIASTTVNTLLSVTYLDGGYLLILYN